jgi:hypothetical protein
MSLAAALRFILGVWQFDFRKKAPAPAEVTGSRGNTQIEPAQITTLIFRGKIVEHEMRHIIPCIRANNPAPLET